MTYIFSSYFNNSCLILQFSMSQAKGNSTWNESFHKFVLHQYDIHTSSKEHDSEEVVEAFHQVYIYDSKCFVCGDKEFKHHTSNCRLLCCATCTDIFKLMGEAESCIPLGRKNTSDFVNETLCVACGDNAFKHGHAALCCAECADIFWIMRRGE